MDRASLTVRRRSRESSLPDRGEPSTARVCRRRGSMTLRGRCWVVCGSGLNLHIPELLIDDSIFSQVDPRIFHATLWAIDLKRRRKSHDGPLAAAHRQWPLPEASHERRRSWAASRSPSGKRSNRCSSMARRSGTAVSADHRSGQRQRGAEEEDVAFNTSSEPTLRSSVLDSNRWYRCVSRSLVALILASEAPNPESRKL